MDLFLSYQLLADAVLMLHVAVVVFVVGGLGLILGFVQLVARDPSSTVLILVGLGCLAAGAVNLVQVRQYRELWYVEPYPRPEEAAESPPPD